VQAALSALPLFHELLGFRFRRVSFNRELRKLTRRKNDFQKIRAHSRNSRIIFFVFIRGVRG
jgi:hypothetical protein